MVKDEQLERVERKIGSSIIRFCREKNGRIFQMHQLYSWVLDSFPEVAPDSPSRILRDLRMRGLIDYQVLNRAESKYLVLSVCTQKIARKYAS